MKTKTERIQDADGFGFEVAWRYNPHATEFEVRELDVSGDGTTDGRVSEPGPDIYLGGFVRGDGCAEILMRDPVHWCGWKDWRKHMQLLGHLFITAFDLMGREPEDAEGLSVFQGAVADRAWNRYQVLLAEYDRIIDAAPAARTPEGEARLGALLDELGLAYDALPLEKQRVLNHPRSNQPVVLYRLRCRELANFPDTAAQRSPMEETRLDALIGELDDLYRALTPEQRAQVEAPRR